jgi:hypothetical protein
MSGCEEAMLSHRRAQPDGLNARRLTPQSGHASFRAVFVLSGNNDTLYRLIPAKPNPHRKQT